MSTIAFYVLNPLLNAVAQFLLKHGAMRGCKFGIIKMYCNRYVISGYTLLSLSMLWTIYIFRIIDLKNITFVIALNYLYATILSALFLKEKVDGRRAAGITIIIAGVILFTTGNYK